MLHKKIIDSEGGDYMQYESKDCCYLEFVIKTDL